jgi:hypothetical protein
MVRTFRRWINTVRRCVILPWIVLVAAQAGESGTGISEPTAAPAGETDVSESQTRELLERILQNAAGARDRLADQEIGAETQALQKHVVDDLEALIDLLKKSPPPSSGGSSSDSAESSQQRDRERNSAADSESKSTGKSKSQGTGEGRDRQQAQDSEEREGKSRDARQRLDRKLRLENDIWGHLPPALREQLLNTYGERMLPQYEEFVRKFYEALSEPTRGKKKH